ncbi:MAG: hypothetical protein OJF59_003260 [Cytophagales bacterium]|jgi:hypothetical protein|nr:hypothetical protein [Bacteroidota bacterium]MBS1982208.1 hypothetical protein [Bacteroidota bacterium]WHZ09504.1 MAG: hypothetical protein OJF59_003260 [Cytophagales bacterium]
MRFILGFVCIVTAFVISNGQDKSSIVVVDTKFSTLPFGFEVGPSNIHKVVKWKMTKERKMGPNGVDSIVTFRHSSNSFSFLNARKGSIFYGAEIVSQGVKLAGGIEIGMLKDNFVKLFKIDDSAKANKFVIKDEFEFCLNNFYFQNGKLTKIVLGGCID